MGLATVIIRGGVEYSLRDYGKITEVSRLRLGSHTFLHACLLVLEFSPNYALSTYMAGVKNDYYYQSSYGVNVFSMRKGGDLMGGLVQGGFGLGLLYSKSGFKDSDDSSESTNTDFLIGPAFRLNWSFFNNLTRRFSFFFYGCFLTR